MQGKEVRKKAPRVIQKSHSVLDPHSVDNRAGAL